MPPASVVIVLPTQAAPSVDVPAPDEPSPPTTTYVPLPNAISSYADPGSADPAVQLVTDVELAAKYALLAVPLLIPTNFAAGSVIVTVGALV